MPVDEDAALIAERSALHETLKALTPQEWDHASLCHGWRVRDVASHAHITATMSVPRLLFGIARHKGDFNRFMAVHVPQLGNRPTTEILREWERFATSADIPPTTKKVEMALDAFVHHHDIAIPLGKDVPSDSQRLRWMADGMVAARRPLDSGGAVKGLRLLATDIDWHYGTGPEVRGPAAALILAACGRRALDDQLDGDGVAELIRRS